MAKSKTDKSKTIFKEIPGGVTAVSGIRASGISCGLKTDGSPDLALFVSDSPCRTAAYYTTNRLLGAHIHVMREKLAASGNLCRAILVNSRVANCSTGAAGIAAAKKITAELAKRLAIPPEQTLHASTGVIGVPLPVPRILSALPAAVDALSNRGGLAAARAIMTTDTRPKTFCIEVREGRAAYRVAGVAKGAGMICPKMATMFIFLFTDADVPGKLLDTISRRVLDVSFNAISVDGDTSPNDTMLVLANGASGVAVRASTPAARRFEDALSVVARKLATEIISDGEGATKLVEIHVTGAPKPADAVTIARAIAHSQLVKTAIFGEDPNWGRILSAAGASGAPFDPDKAALTIGKKGVYRGRPIGVAPANLMKGKTIRIYLDLGLGKATADFLTCDLSLDYVRINADYTT